MKKRPISEKTATIAKTEKNISLTVIINDVPKPKPKVVLNQAIGAKTSKIKTKTSMYQVDLFSVERGGSRNLNSTISDKVYSTSH